MHSAVRAYNKVCTMDLRDRFRDRPEGDAFKWVGVAQTLSDNASVKKILEKARAEAVMFSAFLLGPKGLPSRYLQRPWGGSFVYVAPPGQTPAVKSQPSLDQCRMMGCERMNDETVVAGLMGEPILHSKGFQFHADQFALEEKNIAYIPFETQDPKEARLAMESLEIQGLSITTPLKRTLSELLGLPTIANTVWKRTWGDIWRHANTDQLAFEDALTPLAQGDCSVARAPRSDARKTGPTASAAMEAESRKAPLARRLTKDASCMAGHAAKRRMIGGLP